MQIKPCPFCGSKAKLFSPYENEFWVECINVECTALGKQTLTSERAIEAWNKRVGDTDDK